MFLVLLTACSAPEGLAFRLGASGADGVRPEITEISPSGDVIETGASLVATARITHATDAADALTVALSVDGGEVDGHQLGADGSWTWTTEVTGGPHEAILLVADTDGDSAEAILTWTGNRSPEVDVELPAEGAAFFEGAPIPTETAVSDADVSDPRLLEVQWLLDGVVIAEGKADSDGVVRLSLPGQEVGEPTFTVRLEDGLGVAEDTVTVEIVPRPDTGDTGA